MKIKASHVLDPLLKSYIYVTVCPTMGMFLQMLGCRRQRQGQGPAIPSSACGGQFVLNSRGLFNSLEKSGQVR